MLWRGSPGFYRGKRSAFEDVYVEPRAHGPDGPRMWFGGQQHLHDRLVRYGRTASIR